MIRGRTRAYVFLGNRDNKRENERESESKLGKDRKRERDRSRNGSKFDEDNGIRVVGPRGREAYGG